MSVFGTSAARPNPNGHREVEEGWRHVCDRIIRTQDACALPRGVCARLLSAGASKRTRAIGESRSGPYGDMQKGADLDKNSSSWHRGVRVLTDSLTRRSKGSVLSSVRCFVSISKFPGVTTRMEIREGTV